MFEGQPKGLYTLALANTGERFGYYTMLAIFTLFLQAKFGYTEAETSTIYGGFLAGVYFLPVLGGIMADKFGYKRMVYFGFMVMFLGYLLLSIPAGDTQGKWMMFGALALICLGTGFFKGNLQVMVGNLYDDPRYAAKRDTAFSIFYMAINIGAMFAPAAATKMTEFILNRYHFTYNGKIPALAHQFLDGKITPVNQNILESLKLEQHFNGSTADFCTQYINKLSEAYNYGFAIACVSLIVSLLIYVAFKNTYKNAEGVKAVKAEVQKEEADNVVFEDKKQQQPKETLQPAPAANDRQRMVALLLVFAVVIFFWMAFHQNGLTLTYFARDYTSLDITGLTRLVFDVFNLTLLVVAVYAAFAIFQSKTSKGRMIATVVTAAALISVVANYIAQPANVEAQPQTFQQFNPFFVIVLTPVSLAIFSALAKRGKEPSAPRKIGMGMLVAAIAFTVMSIGSIHLPTPDALKSDAGLSVLTSPNLLISTYLILTFAELLLSPMGISFVSKVAPEKYKGLMMGGWFAATAVGNYAVSIIGHLWGGLQLWLVWGILVALCLLSAVFMFSMMKRLEKVA